MLLCFPYQRPVDSICALWISFFQAQMALQRLQSADFLCLKQTYALGSINAESMTVRVSSLIYVSKSYFLNPAFVKAY